MHYIIMGVCYLQHRIISGTYNNICRSSKSIKSNPDKFSHLSGCVNKLNYIGFIILYMYILVLNLAMAVDLGTQCAPVVGFDRRLLLPQGHNMLFSMQRHFGHFFVIIMCLIFKMKTAKRYLNEFGIISWGRLTKMKRTVPTKVSFVASYWILAINFLLTIICHPCLLNFGFIIAIYFVIWKRTLFGQLYI